MTEYRHDIAVVASRNRQVELNLKDRPRLFRGASVIIALIALLGYFSWHAWEVVSPPELAIISPDESFVVYDRDFVLEGTVTPGSELFINNSEVLVGEDGSFSQNVNLHSGANEFVLTAKKPYSSKVIVSRTVYYKTNDVVKRLESSVTN